MFAGLIAGEVVPYVRIGRERWTPRATRYLGARDVLRAEIALSVRGQVGPRAGPLAVSLHFHRWRQIGDIDNLAKAFLDAGNGILWPDDRVIAELHVYRYRVAKGQDGIRFSVKAVDNFPVSSPN